MERQIERHIEKQRDIETERVGEAAIQIDRERGTQTDRETKLHIKARPPSKHLTKLDNLQLLKTSKDNTYPKTSLQDQIDITQRKKATAPIIYSTPKNIPPELYYSFN